MRMVLHSRPLKQLTHPFHPAPRQILASSQSPSEQPCPLASSTHLLRRLKKRLELMHESAKIVAVYIFQSLLTNFSRWESFPALFCTSSYLFLADKLCYQTSFYITPIVLFYSKYTFKSYFFKHPFLYHVGPSSAICRQLVCCS